MLISEAFPTKYLKAADLKDQQVRVQMASIEMEDVGDDEMKPVLYFVGKDKGLVVNKTNANNIAAAYGDDTDDWMGQDLILYPTMVDFQGRSVAAIRVRAPKPSERRAPAKPFVETIDHIAQPDFMPAPVRPVQNGAHRMVPVRQTVSQELNDEIPF